jgi:guanyl-specific ribonuclease Sa
VPATLVLVGLFAVVAVALWLLNGSHGSAPVVTSGAGATSGSVATSGPKATSGRTAASRPAVTADRTVSGQPPSAQPPSAGAPVRAKALYVLGVVDATGQAPQGYVGGRQFLNDSRGGTTLLPRRDAAGAAVTYHEYDVNPRRPGVNRGPQRLVVGSDGSAWVTADHYVTWSRLR